MKRADTSQQPGAHYDKPTPHFYSKRVESLTHVDVRFWVWKEITLSSLNWGMVWLKGKYDLKRIYLFQDAFRCAAAQFGVETNDPEIVGLGTMVMTQLDVVGCDVKS